MSGPAGTLARSGILRIESFSLSSDGRLDEPLWFRENNGQQVTPPRPIHHDMVVIIENLHMLDEDVFVSWAADNLEHPQFFRSGLKPEESRDPACPVKFVITLNQELERKLREHASTTINQHSAGNPTDPSGPQET